MKLGPNVHGPGDYEEILLMEKIALEDKGVRAEIAKLGLPKGTIIVSDPWIYGRLVSQKWSRRLIPRRIRWYR